MRQLLILVLSAPLLLPTAQEEKISFERLRHADLQKLAGGWEMKVDLKSGWKGTIELHVLVHGPDGDLDGACRLTYWASLTRGEKDRIIVINARPPRQVVAAGVKRGSAPALVSRGREKRGDRYGLAPVDPRPELTAPFKLDGDKLTLDLSNSRDSFLPAKLLTLDLDFANMQFTRSDKKRIGK
ncbi:MAG: hypothetical protein U0793_08050 [Gemmataceae bacterium]